MNDPTSSWKYLMAVPIVLGGTTYQLPVGCIVISSDSGASFLKDLEPLPELELLNFLSKVGSRLLSKNPMDGNDKLHIETIPRKSTVEEHIGPPVIEYRNSS